jgi:hypothetical protein
MHVYRTIQRISKPRLTTILKMVFVFKTIYILKRIINKQFKIQNTFFFLKKKLFKTIIKHVLGH